MRGTGKHEGSIELKAAFFLTKEDRITGGSFTADMTSIAVTDIPEHEPIPRKRLNDHLKSADFFDVLNYCAANLEITEVELSTNNSLIISGNLTIKDVTKNISFTAVRDNNTYYTQFIIDRFQWNVGYSGSWAEHTLVDNNIELTITLKMEGTEAKH